MTELFTNVDPEAKQYIQDLIELAIHANNIRDAQKILKQTRDLCSEEELEFMDFYFSMRMEELNGDSNPN